TYTSRRDRSTRTGFMSRPGLPVLPSRATGSATSTRIRNSGSKKDRSTRTGFMSPTGLPALLLSTTGSDTSTRTRKSGSNKVLLTLIGYTNPTASRVLHSVEAIHKLALSSHEEYLNVR